MELFCNDLVDLRFWLLYDVLLGGVWLFCHIINPALSKVLEPKTSGKIIFVVIVSLMETNEMDTSAFSTQIMFNGHFFCRDLDLSLSQIVENMFLH